MQHTIDPGSVRTRSLLPALALGLALATPLRAGDFSHTVLARSGQDDLTYIDPRLGVNAAGMVAFAADGPAGSQLFAVMDPGELVPSSFEGGDDRDFNGAAINDQATPLIASRDRLGSQYRVRTWATGSTNSFTIVGSSASDFDSAQLHVDVNASGQVAFSGKTAGSTLTALFVGDGTGSPSELATYGSTAKLRPEISDDGLIVITDPLGNVVLWTTALPSQSTLVANTIGSAGLEPGISRDGQAVSFSGNFGDGDAPWVALPVAKGWQPLQVAGPGLDDLQIVEDARVAVQASGGADDKQLTVVFVAERDGTQGIHAVTLGVSKTAGEWSVDNRSAAVVAEVGDSLAESTITAVFLNHPIDGNGRVAWAASLKDGGRAVVRSSSENFSVEFKKPPEDALPTVMRRKWNATSEYALKSRLKFDLQKLQLIVTGPDGKPPASPVKLTLTVSGADGESDHEHGGTRPTGWLFDGAKPFSKGKLLKALKKDLVLEKKDEGGALPGETLTLAGFDGAQEITIETQKKGKAIVYFLPPEVAGLERVSVAFTEVAGTTDDVEIEVRTPKFSPLGTAPDGLWTLENNTPEVHDRTDYGSKSMLKALQKAAAFYRDQQLKDTAIGDLAAQLALFTVLVEPVPLRINDISLPWGGLMDVGADWAASHGGHRWGIQADIKTVHLVTDISNAQNTAVGDDEAPAQVDSLLKQLRYRQYQLLETALAKKGFKLFKEGNHLHITLKKPIPDEGETGV